MKKQSRHPLRKTDSELTKKDSGRGVELSAPPAARARENAAEAARTYFGSENNPESNRRSARAFLMGAAQAAVIIPILFYLQFGVIDSFALSFTGFVVVLCLLVALGYYAPDKPEYQTTAARKSGPLGYVGAFWLVACAFGPFFGWLITAPEFPVTEDNWFWRYAVRAVLSVGLPMLTALPLVVYVRGKFWYVALLLLVCVTSLSVWSGANTLRDLREGPAVKQSTGYYDAPNNSFYPSAEGKTFKLMTLTHTQRTIKIEPAPPDAKGD